MGCNWERADIGRKRRVWGGHDEAEEIIGWQQLDENYGWWQ